MGGENPCWTVTAATGHLKGLRIQPKTKKKHFENDIIEALETKWVWCLREVDFRTGRTRPENSLPPKEEGYLQRWGESVFGWTRVAR